MVKRVHILFFCCLQMGIFCFLSALRSQPFLLKAGDNGWVVKKGIGKKKYDRFFATGTWHVPGYSFSDSMENDAVGAKNEALFKSKAAPFNMVFVTPGQQKKYMVEKIHVLNPFSPMLHNYIDRRLGLSKEKDKDYYRSQFLKGEANSNEFVQYLDSSISDLLKKLPNDKYIYSHIDEIALGGVSKWMIPPAVGAKIYERVKKLDANALFFVDLVGHGRGSTFFFEQRYLEQHNTMPSAPPYSELGEYALANKANPLLVFFESSDGRPLYEFDKEGNYRYKEYDIVDLKKLWFENLRIIADAYKGCGNVFGINAFRDFFAHPILSAVTMDALKAGLGQSTPIWLYFDGNGYAKPANLSAEEYVRQVKCQIYTSIIHGATGILFWNDWSKKPEVFDALLPMLEDLNSKMHIFKLPTVEERSEGNKHILIKQAHNKKYLIASNTSKTSIITLDLAKGKVATLYPLEAKVFEL